jgi:hypothetical protein
MACFSVSSYGTYHFDSLVLPCLFCSSINRICTSRALREPLLRHRGTPPAQARPRSFLPYCSAKCAGHWARCPCFPYGSGSPKTKKKHQETHPRGVFYFVISAKAPPSRPVGMHSPGIMMLCGWGHQRYFGDDCTRGSVVYNQPSIGGTQASAGLVTI